MTNQSSSIPEIERELLTILCAGADLSQTRRENAIRSLDSYKWASPDHQLIFEAIRRCGHREAGDTREFLAAEVTRLGFPDIELANYFVPLPSGSSRMESLVAALLNSA